MTVSSARRSQRFCLATLTLFGMALLSACVSPPRELPPLDPTRFGLSACEPAVLEDCRLIADRTFHSVGPRQMEYHAPDGHAFLWIGDRIVRGYWVVRPKSFLIAGSQICYLYEGETVPDCSPLGNKGTVPTAYRQGDLYGLSGRATAPFNLNSLPAFTSGFEVVSERIAALPR